MITLQWLDKSGMAWAQQTVKDHHYLHQYVSNRAAPMGYSVHLADGERVGVLIVGRAEATRTRGFFGPCAEWQDGRYPYTNWEILNLARVWFDPVVQPGGERHTAYWLPGFTDRRGVFRSTLASVAIGRLLPLVVVDYLIAKPPIWPALPWRLRWLISYCDTRVHRGAIYRASGFSLYDNGNPTIQLWRRPLPPLTPAEERAILLQSQHSKRAQTKRAKLAPVVYQQVGGLF